MTPVRLEPATPRCRVKHSTTEPLRSLLESSGNPDRKLCSAPIDLGLTVYLCPGLGIYGHISDIAFCLKFDVKFLCNYNVRNVIYLVAMLYIYTRQQK